MHHCIHCNTNSNPAISQCFMWHKPLSVFTCHLWFIKYLVHHQVYKLSLHWNPFYRSIFWYMRWLDTFISTLSVHLNCQVSNYACPPSLLTRQAVTSFPSLMKPKIINLNLLRTHGRKEHRKRFFKNFTLNLSIKRIFQIWKSGWCHNESRTLITWLQLYHLPSVKLVWLVTSRVSTHWNPNKKAAMLQSSFSNAFS